MALRDVDPELESRLKQAAREGGKRIDQTAIEALRRRFGLAPERLTTHIHTDLDHLFGQRDEVAFRAIQLRLDGQRKVDAELRAVLRRLDHASRRGGHGYPPAGRAPGARRIIVKP